MRRIEIPQLRYADDTVLLSESTKGLVNLIISVKKYSEYRNLFLNIQKTKIISTDKSKQQPKIVIQNEKIENVSSYEYL
jgi:hypothetical protein